MYKQLLNENNSNLLRKLLNTDMCKLDADTLLKKCLIEPIDSLLQTQTPTFNLNYFFVIIDGLDECSSGGSNQLGSFLVKHVSMLPKWFKLLITTRDDSWLVERLKTTCHVITLDSKSNLNRSSTSELVSRFFRCHNVSHNQYNSKYAFFG